MSDSMGHSSNKVGTLSMKIKSCIEYAKGALKYMNYFSWKRVNPLLGDFISKC